nr:protein phosphatase 2C domain-containing protein [Eubacterium sp.]
VADGVGSAVHSDLGAQTATQSLLDYCNKKIRGNSSVESIKQILRDGYEFAFKKVQNLAARRKRPITEFDTTLSAAVYNGDVIVFAHAGDGGIIVGYEDGQIKPITKRQKGEDGYTVRPLRAGRESWEFGVSKEGVVSVLLLTDGMLDGLVQPNLLNLPETREDLVSGNFTDEDCYVTATEFFVNPYSVFRNPMVENPEEYLEFIVRGDLEEKDERRIFQCVRNGYEYLLGTDGSRKIWELYGENNYILKAMRNISDDKSIVAIIDGNKKVKGQEESYYFEPDWDDLQERYNVLLYDQTLSTEVDDLPLMELEAPVEMLEPDATDEPDTTGEPAPMDETVPLEEPVLILEPADSDKPDIQLEVAPHKLVLESVDDSAPPEQVLKLEPVE